MKKQKDLLAVVVRAVVVVVILSVVVVDRERSFGRAPDALDISSSAAVNSNIIVLAL